MCGEITEESKILSTEYKMHTAVYCCQKSEFIGNTVTWFCEEEQNLPKTENELAQLWGAS
jgi:hypothetical protein